ncbi:MAG: hypothetical protein RI883_308 [Bacteroidota bacterium]|jgi:hypothetical protein
MKKKIYLFAFVFLTFTAFSQKGKVEIIKDSRIDGLVKKQGMIIPPATSPQIPGYRVQLFFDSDRKAVDDARSKFIASYPKIDSYVLFNSPNYVLKVGDFRTLLEAERIKDSFVQLFPTSFIVKELINLPRIDQE